ncbi:Hypothetical protein KVN_LOCUS270 [uncultured virus]|nr:Hypothetical protein KVN_LOCUS270 [uncultured virus]
MWIETDLEPDDVLALFILPKAKYFVVGEGDANIKFNRMIQYSKLLNNNSSIIIQGINSFNQFPLDGNEFDSLSHLSCEQNYLDNFTKFATSEDPIMFSLKPMRELVNEYIKDKELIKKLVSNITLYAYGGYNFRCLFKDFKEELLELIHQFKKVYIYESFYVSGNKNSVNKYNAENLYKFFNETNNEYFKILSKLIYNWNMDLKNKIISSINNLNIDEDSKKRQQKILENINNNEKFQFVLADFGLAAVYRNIDAVPIKNLQFTNYTIFEPSTRDTNIYAYQNISFDIILNLLQNYIENIN